MALDLIELEIIQVAEQQRADIFDEQYERHLAASAARYADEIDGLQRQCDQHGGHVVPHRSTLCCICRANVAPPAS